MNDRNPFAETVPLDTLPTVQVPGSESSDFGVQVSIPAVGARRLTHEDDDRWSALAIDETPLVPPVMESGGPPPRGGRMQDYRGRRSFTSVLLVVIPMAIIIVVVALVVAGLDSSATSHRRGGPTARGTVGGQPLQGNSAATAGCREQHDGADVTGAGPGGQKSGPDVILWFQHSYYVERSAIRARQVVAPNATVTTAEEIQRGIESVPVGTEYCVRITALGETTEPGIQLYRVELTEQRPGEAESTFTQQVTTTSQDSNTVITGIAPA